MKNLGNTFFAVLFSALIGASAAFVLAVQFFGYQGYGFIDRFFLIAVPAISLAWLIYSFSINPYEWIAVAKRNMRGIKIGLFLLAAFLLFLLIQKLSTLALAANLFLVAAIIFFGVYYPIKKWQKGQNIARLLVAWLLAFIPSFLVTGYLCNFHKAIPEIVLIAFLLFMAFGLAGYHLTGKLPALKKQPEARIALALFFVIMGFTAAVFRMGSQYPRLFDTASFSLKRDQITAFLAAFIFSLPWLAWSIHTITTSNGLKTFKLVTFWDENWPGILLAGLFFPVYFQLATILNRTDFDVDDIFFDADGLNWRVRLTTGNWVDYYWRSVHPLAILLLRPPIAFIASFLNGEKLPAAMVFVAFTGALCVFLVWFFIKRTTQVQTYALLVASILGASVSHLVFGSLIEMYIFTAAGLLIFYVLLLEKKPFLSLILSALFAMGITLTNFVQNIFALFIVKPNLKLIARFVAIVSMLLVGLSVANNLVYPGANPFFFVPSSYIAEEQNIFPFNAERVQVLVRGFGFYNVIAPTPILYTKDIPFTQFRFFKPEIHKLGNYRTNLEKVTAWFWLLLLVLAGILFLLYLKRSPYIKYSLALLGCIVLNLGINLRYGKELFLYSPNWTYALILLLGLAWGHWARYKWLQLCLLVFLILLMMTNLQLFNTMINISAQHFVPK